MQYHAFNRIKIVEEIAHLGRNDYFIGDYLSLRKIMDMSSLAENYWKRCIF